MKKFKKIVLLSFIACSVVFGCCSRQVSAKENTFGIQIAPSIQQTGAIDPGKTYRNKLSVTNNEDEPIELEMVVEPYSVENGSYTPNYSKKTAFTEIVNWIEFDDYETHLEPGETTEVDYTVKIPSSTHGGGQYAVLFAQAKKTDDGENSIQAIARSGTILFAKVNGDIIEKGKIVDIKTDTFLLAPPINASVKLTNTGNIDTTAKITVDIENAITGEKIYSNADSPRESSLLPETEKDVNLRFDNVLRLGVMHLTMRVEYLDDIQIINRTVIICPIWLIIIIVAIIIIIVAKILIKKRENSKKRSNSRGFEKPSEKFNIGG